MCTDSVVLTALCIWFCLGSDEGEEFDVEPEPAWEAPAEQMETDLELQLHILGYKSLWTQNPS